ncbi:menaquinone biosynthesis protein [Botrimarina sp.]|uniref:menaquinone biosynthetic enzyme MqnA/MqnD family protein n=1 Tax=Botrimarina sp. TaxID=2795802 RepID=UPI0032EACF7D
MPDRDLPPPLRIGAVNYLNSKPLIFRFADHAARLAGGRPSLAGARLLCDLPSRLADSLAAGRLDVALVPVFETFANPDWQVLSDACVAADGPVGSVKVYFRKPPHCVRTLALDEGSRTSAALCRLLLDRRCGVRPERRPLPIGCGLADADADAVLLIGDRAMHPPAAAIRDRFVAAWDLAHEWRIDTGQPFVFAVWAARPGAPAEALTALLQACRDDGLAHLDHIAAAEGPPLGLTADHAQRYLRDNLRYRFGARQHDALARFQSLCREAGLLPAPAAAS